MLPWYPAKSWLGNVWGRVSCFYCCWLCHIGCILAPLWDAVLPASCLPGSSGVQGGETTVSILEPVEVAGLPAVGARSELMVWRGSVGAAALAYAVVLAATPLPSVGLCPQGRLPRALKSGRQKSDAEQHSGRRDVRPTLLLSFAATSIRIMTWPKLGKERRSSFSGFMTMTSPCGRLLEVRIKWFSLFHAHLIKSHLIISLIM